ncbi:JDVT-CTERM system glutamic-type intramembrane protease MrtJ [Granulosicoccus sp. 3-233]|uniref:JDVT-CTERM system glutamic-type intramembrane protease MrtJ n=1 Tax=Granulosicoccus sp. 3-233 TaxID=3417969 RepID=UPI003D344454
MGIAPVSWWLMQALGVARRTEPLAISPLLMIVIVNPVLEEIVFRGGVQDWLQGRRALRHRWGPLSLANVLTSLLFASVHLLRQPPLWAALTFLPSLIFGWAKERHETLLSPIVLHMSYNAGFIWLFA